MPWSVPFERSSVLDSVSFGDLRRRRNELRYPRLPADTANEDEAAQAIEVARQLIAAAKVLFGKLSFFA